VQAGQLPQDDGSYWQPRRVRLNRSQSRYPTQPPSAHPVPQPCHVEPEDTDATFTAA
jgi:hypothetical protein